jgi:AcrR family transcriptional regulator
MRAAVALVAERGTTAVPISDIAEAADASRQLVYLHFGDREALLREAAIDLARRELLPQLQDAPDALNGRSRALAIARHFAEHRSFYRAMLTGSSAFALNKALNDMLVPLNRRSVEVMLGERLDPETADALATFLTGGGAAIFNTWVVEGEDPLDPEQFTDLLMRMLFVLTGAVHAHAGTVIPPRRGD